MKRTKELKSLLSFYKNFSILLILLFYTLLASCNICNAEVNNCPKVVSVSPEITEIIYELNAQNCLVGIDINSNFPNEAQKLPKVADYYNLNQEKISQLQTDIILLSKSYNSMVVNKNSQFKNKLISLDLSSIASLKESITKIGELLHKQETARKVNLQIDESITKNTKQNINKKIIKTAILLWSKPLMIAGKSSLINELITICRAKNMYDKYNIAFQIVDPENIFAQKINVLISMTDDKLKFSDLPIVYLSPIERDILSRTTPRAVKEGIPILCQIIDSARTID